MSFFFVMLKPDCVERGLIGEVIWRFERRGIKILNMKLFTPETELIEAHYSEHKGKSFYDNLMGFMEHKPVVAMICYGNIMTARVMIGDTYPYKAQSGTIRGDFASSTPQNIIHCSDSEESAQREVELWSKYI